MAGDCQHPLSSGPRKCAKASSRKRDTSKPNRNETTITETARPEIPTRATGSDVRQSLPPAEIDCKWWKQGYCFRGSACYFRHDATLIGVDKPKHKANRENTKQREGETGGGTGQEFKESYSASPSGSLGLDNAAVPAVSIQEQCAICLQTPSTLGLLVNCDHLFCLECIREWRASAKQESSSSPFGAIDGSKSLKKASKTCPICRTYSEFIVPSSVFPTPLPKSEVTAESITVKGKDTERVRSRVKQEIINDYLAQLKTVPCRYFEASVDEQQESSTFQPVCRFANDCHYAHTHPITRQPYIFSAAELEAMKERRALNRRRLRNRDAERLLTTEMMLWGLASLALDMSSEEEDDWFSD